MVHNGERGSKISKNLSTWCMNDPFSGSVYITSQVAFSQIAELASLKMQQLARYMSVYVTPKLKIIFSLFSIKNRPYTYAFMQNLKVQ